MIFVISGICTNVMALMVRKFQRIKKKCKYYESKLYWGNSFVRIIAIIIIVCFLLKIFIMGKRIVVNVLLFKIYVVYIVY